MKRGISLIVVLSIMFTLHSCTRNIQEQEKTPIKIGVIDGCISSEMIDELQLKEYYLISDAETNNNITHGSMICSIIKQECKPCEIYYCSIYDESCIGNIENIEPAINWCIENNVDIITMSFDTLNDNENIRDSVQRAIDNNIIVIASCINLSDKTCYPAMYDNVISVSEGFNNQATIILKGKKVKFDVDGKKMEKTQVSFLTAYVCGKIGKKLSNGYTVEEAINTIDFD